MQTNNAPTSFLLQVVISPALFPTGQAQQKATGKEPNVEVSSKGQSRAGKDREWTETARGEGSVHCYHFIFFLKISRNDSISRMTKF